MEHILKFLDMPTPHFHTFYIHRKASALAARYESAKGRVFHLVVAQWLARFVFETSWPGPEFLSFRERESSNQMAGFLNQPVLEKQSRKHGKPTSWILCFLSFLPPLQNQRGAAIQGYKVHLDLPKDVKEVRENTGDSKDCHSHDTFTELLIILCYCCMSILQWYEIQYTITICLLYSFVVVVVVCCFPFLKAVVVLKQSLVTHMIWPCWYRS